MKRRSKVTFKPVKLRRRKASKQKGGLAPNEASRPTTSAVDKDEQIARLTHERDEVLEQQAATTDILQLISSSPENLQAVFATILENAVRICDASFGDIGQLENGVIRLLAIHKATPPAFIELRRRTQRVPPASDSPSARILATKVPLHIHDLKCDRAYLERSAPMTVAAVELGGFRTFLGVPLLKEHEVIGLMFLGRQFVRPFTDKQIELVKNFAAQAVIAIENARLLNELRQRTTDLTEALEQQTATSEVLRVVSSSPGDLQPVFAAMLENALRICGANFGNLLIYESDAYRVVPMHNAPEAYASLRTSTRAIRPSPEDALGRIAATKELVHITDLVSDDSYQKGTPLAVSGATLAGIRTFLGVPMLKDDHLVGAIVIYRQEVRPFNEKQIALMQNFATQAVIAIENARLLNELRQRTTDLTEALEQQRATSDLLQVISGSPGNLEPVFHAMLENAVAICGANFGNMFIYEDDTFRAVAMYNAPEAYTNARAGGPFHPPSDSTFGVLAATKEVVQIADLRSEQRYINRDPFAVAGVELAGIRTILAVPMLKESRLVGCIDIYRQEVAPFSEKQIELVKNFASQVVIAIENSRLLNELRDRTSELERSYKLVQQQASQLEAQAQQLEQRVADQVGEIERIGRLRRFLPPQVADLIVASGSEKQLESHRREITALFCDLRGFTGFTESADAEDVIALLREYHAAVGEKIIKYNGTLERYAGDGVMVVFNDPVPVENPALQAVLMALEMRDAIGALTETWHRWGHDIGFGIGIAHGFATLGTIGFEGRFDYAAIGTVSNVASRLCDEAKPGQILISPRVLTKVENAVKVEPVGEFELKGIRRPLAAYNVLSAASSAA